jgi:hypothetical protein
MVVVMIDDIIGKLTELFCSALLFMIKIFIEIASFVIVIATAILHDI